MKTCSKCKIEKSVEEFNKRSDSPDGLRGECKPCLRSIRQKRYLLNRDSICLQRKEYRKANLELVKITEKKTKAKNRPTINRRNRDRYDSDDSFRSVTNTRNNLNRILDGSGSHAPTLELLGCTGKEWRAHLESTFKPGMTWGNYGRGESEWQIDHIAPVSSFDQENHLQQLICWNYRNTQALWSHENMAKGDTISTEGGAA
jgi:hypothetical protein